MDTRNYLLEQMKKCRHKMNTAKAIDRGILFAAAGGVFGIFCEGFSLIRPFYYANLTAAVCFGIGLLAGVCYAVYQRADLKRAAGKLDSFGLQERMLTAYENMDKEDDVSQLQRQDTFVHYERIREQVKIPILPDKRHIMALLVSVAAVVGLGLLPSPVRDQAALRHQVKEQAEEEKETLEEFLEALESVEMESLKEEQKARLRELAETMELSREELRKADSWESLSAATQRLDYKYGQAAQSLRELAGQTAHTEVTGIAGAEAFAKAAANRNGQQTAATGSGSGSGSQDSGGSGEEGSGNHGSPGDGNGSDSGNSSGQSGENGSGEGDGQGGGNKSASGNGSGAGDGNGQSGNGSGESGSGGDGNSSGNGNGQGGSGSGTGGGRGEGHSNAAHDYVSVPGKFGDDASLVGNKTGDENSDYYRDKNGLAWEGSHVDYNSVIGEYTDSAYEGIANGKYPDGMESVIRDYFEQLNQ